MAVAAASGAEVLGAARRLRSTTVAIDGLSDTDLVRIGGSPGALLWERDGAGLAGIGSALRIELPGGLADPDGPLLIGRALTAIDADNDVGLPGTGPVVIGALPFDRRAPASLVVPAAVVGRGRDGRSWVTVVRPTGGDHPLAPLLAALAAGAGSDAAPANWRHLLAPYLERALPPPPDGFTLTSRRPHDEWCALVADTVRAVETGALTKVVLAREVAVEANRPFVTTDVLGRLHALYPSCMVFSVDGFLGASPELLIGRRGPDVVSHPLAGTVARSGDRDNDRRLDAALLASSKERQEHRVVVEAVAEALGPFCETIDVPEAPSILELRNVSHLGTRVTGRLAGAGAGAGAGASAGAGPASALELAAALHPTPAVAGTPRQDALGYLARVEGFDRGRFAGPVGWMDRNGDGDWAVGIRCAEVDGSTARLFAGVGVVAGSEPRAELAETQLKLQALLAALVRP